MKILITGINGFVGKILHSHLESQNYKIYGIDLKGNNENIFSADICSFKSVNEILQKISPDYIIHLAAISRVDFNNPKQIYDINVNGTINLLTASIKLEKKPKFLYISSSQVYGNVNKSLQPITEKQPINPINHYGASKSAGENIAKIFNIEYNLPLVIARPFNHTGNGQLDHFVIPKIANAIKNNEKTITLGNINTERDILDVRDVVNAYTKIIEKFSDGEIFNIASGKGIIISDIINILKDLTGNTIQINTQENLIRKNEISSSIGNSELIRKTLNWEPQYELIETLKWMIN